MVSNRGSLAFGILLSAMALMLAEDYPVKVTPGVPSIWSMEQAHYLLNRARANNDQIHSRPLSESDLDPNAVNALRLEALQTSLSVAASVDSVNGLQNRLALQRYNANLTAVPDLQRQLAEAKDAYQKRQEEMAELKGKKATQDSLVAAATTDKSVTAPSATAIADLAGQIAAQQSRIDSAKGKVDGLASTLTAISKPELATTNPPDTPAKQDRLLADATKALLAKAADKFDQPKLHASIALDNYLQMQYEIVAKQLTALRDEAGKGRRIIFLELPTSIASADRRLLGNGGEDKLAQSWWKVTKIYRRYKTEESPCWQGDDGNELIYNVDAVSRSLNRAPACCSTASTQAGEIVEEISKVADSFSDSYSDLKKLWGAIGEGETRAGISVAEHQLDSMDFQLRSLDTKSDMFRSQLLLLLTARPGTRARSQVVQAAEQTCAETNRELALDLADLGRLKDVIEARRSKSDSADVDKALSVVRNLARQLQRAAAGINDYQQALILGEFGGVEGLAKAYHTDVASNATNSPVSAVELIPRQTALNVNTAHANVHTTAISFVWRTVFGLGLKTDYQQQREKFDQFLQQEAFASGIGKGLPTFGWIFGPLPGTRVLNSGTRTTYAVLSVPDDATALEIVAAGCAFHRKDHPSAAFPPYGESNIVPGLPYCNSFLSTAVGIPSRINSGGFWPNEVEFKEVRAGEHATVILRGSYFSPQTTVLVNGRRLPQVLGLGKPNQTMDAAGAEPGDDSAITGSFEYVNEKAIVLRLTTPKTLRESKFPVITLISPMRAINVNRLRLRINGTSRARLEDEHILRKDDPPSFQLSAWRYLDRDSSDVRLQLEGQLLQKIKEARLNGKKCDELEKISSSLAQITCTPSSNPDWTVTLVADAPKPEDPKAVRLTGPNPLMFGINSYRIPEDSIEYDKTTNSPVAFKVLLTGSGFTPRMMLTPKTAGATISLSYVSTTQLMCSIEKPQKELLLEITAQDPTQTPSAIIVPLPPKRKDPGPAGTTTVTTVQSEKKVTQK